MSDSQKPSSGQSVDAAPGQGSVPGRTLGFTLMTLMILFAGYWMQRAGEPGAVSSSALPMSETGTGFDGTAWFLPADSTLGFVQIPAGVFTMGSNPALDSMAYENERWSSSQRQGEVELPLYYIARTEVTVAQFAAFVAATGRNTIAGAGAGSGTLPVTDVTWAEAIAYGQWLEQQLRAADSTPDELKRFLEAGARITLPDEAEWEKAARGTDARIFPWGSEPTSQYANFASSSADPVGSRNCPPCSYGLADMSGNVWEFTRSALQDYPFDGADDFTDFASDPLMVMRGGSYADPINNVRAAVRGGVDPGVRSPTIGFRLAISTR